MRPMYATNVSVRVTHMTYGHMGSHYEYLVRPFIDFMERRLSATISPVVATRIRAYLLAPLVIFDTLPREK